MMNHLLRLLKVFSLNFECIYWGLTKYQSTKDDYASLFFQCFYIRNQGVWQTIQWVRNWSCFRVVVIHIINFQIGMSSRGPTRIKYKGFTISQEMHLLTETRGLLHFQILCISKRVKNRLFRKYRIK